MSKSFEAVLGLSADDFATYFNSQVAVALGRKGVGARLSPAETDKIKELRRDLYEKLKAVRLRKSELAFCSSVKEMYPDLEKALIEAARATLLVGLETAPAAAGAGAGATAAVVVREAPHLGSLNVDPLGIIASYLAPEGKGRLAKITKPMSADLKNYHKRTKFLHHVARGQQAEAEAMLRTDASLLTQQDEFSDYSSRSFNCTAYEYAYWAKDTHMCRMLESFVDEEAKAVLRKCIDTMEERDPTTGQARGIEYWQGGVKHHSTHFDLSPLKAALQRYVDGHAAWEATNNSDAATAAWLEVGRAQRDVPAHVAQEYCRLDRSFHPTPDFTEETLPRGLLFSGGSWLSAVASSTSGLGFDFSLIRGRLSDQAIAARRGFTEWAVQWLYPERNREWAVDDLAAVTHLDEVRTADLRLSRDHLNPLATSPRLSR